MTVKIESIQILKLGPLDSIQLDLGMLNLIYGHNESGKTYLVEFLLQSIFRHANNWDLRDINAEGSVTLKGLGEQITTFSPATSKKIEDYWDQNNTGLPLNMARLLVVKGGELALSGNSPGGVNREVLKNALTGQALLDQIRDGIQPTIRNAEIIDQRVTGKNQGQIKDLNNLHSELQDLDSLVKEIEQNYSQGPTRQIEIQIENIKTELNQQNKAKRHLAYTLSKTHQDLLIKREEISDNTLLSLRDRVRDHKNLRANLKALSKIITSMQVDIETYHWLESAAEIWEEKELETKGLPKKILGAGGGIFLFTGLALIVVQYILSRPDLFWAGVITAAIGGLLLVLFGFKLLKWSTTAGDSDERDNIQASFKEKFDQPLKGKTGLKAQQNKLQENYLKVKSIKEEYGKLEIQLDSDSQRIKEIFLEMLGKTIKEKNWETSLESIKNESDSLDSEISEMVLEITRLNLNEEDFLTDPQEIEYDSQTKADLEKTLVDLKNDLLSLQSTLDTLKARACEWTRDDISHPWSDVLHHLRTIQKERMQSCLDLTAEIVAKIGLSKILSRIENEEDQKILENLNTGEVSNLLKRLTGKYQNIDLVDDQVYVRDPYREYPLRDLSTGAREQVQLALRLGIASRVSGGAPMFVILDDAFQHSDWNRRKSLVQETVELVKQGWQIIYLSMDDHIRDLFQETAKPVLKRKFKYFEL